MVGKGAHQILQQYRELFIICEAKIGNKLRKQTVEKIKKSELTKELLGLSGGLKWRLSSSQKNCAIMLLDSLNPSAAIFQSITTINVMST